MIDTIKLIDLVLRCYEKARSMVDPTKVITKSKHNYVTSLDLTLEEILKEELLVLDNSYGFICEESANEKSDKNWVIDPIDGTTNYLNGLTFTTSLAEMHDNQIVRGLVVDYCNNQVFYAEKGKGAWVYNYRVGQKKRLEPMVCYKTIGAFGIPYNRSKVHKILTILENNMSIFDDVKRIGPSSLDICRVATGSISCYFELDLELWDVAAASLILTEAGGSVEKRDDLLVFSCASFNQQLQ